MIDKSEIECVTGFEKWHRSTRHPTMAGAWLNGVDYGTDQAEKRLKAAFMSMVESACVRDSSLQKMLIAIPEL